VNVTISVLVTVSANLVSQVTETFGEGRTAGKHDDCCGGNEQCSGQLPQSPNNQSEEFDHFAAKIATQSSMEDVQIMVNY
jgi:hypothetical protein